MATTGAHRKQTHHDSLRAVIALHCANCGAPLEVEEHESLVKCKYCQATTRVRERTLHLAAPSVNQWPPPATPMGAPRLAFSGKTNKRLLQAGAAAGGCGTVIGGLGAVIGGLAGVGGAIIAIVVTILAVVGGPDCNNCNGGLRQLAPASLKASCVVDANGDAVADVATMRTHGSGSFVEVFDGRTGTSLWHGEDVTGGPAFLCVGHHVALALADFTTRIYDVRSPGAPLVMRGSDVTRTLSQGEGCLELGAADGSHVAVAVDGSNATSCDAHGTPHGTSDAAPGVMGLTAHEAMSAQDTEGIRLTARQQGTEMLSLRPSYDAAEHPLSFMKCTFSAAVAASPTTIFVQGCAVGADKAAFVVALRRADLVELWRTPIGGGSEWDVDDFEWNGRALLVRASNEIYALDGATGATLWTIN